MSVIDTLIFDRSWTDIDEAIALRDRIKAGVATSAEIAQYAAGNLKGGYNATDLNRVGEACEYIYQRFVAKGYSIPSYTALKTDWTITDKPTAAQLSQYISVVRILRDALDSSKVLPDSMSSLTITGANQIESVLYWLEDAISRISWVFTAQFNAYAWTSNLYFYDKSVRDWAGLDALNTTWANWQVATWLDLLVGDMTETGVVA